ncbi:hypothetical protein [Mycolicibacterium peregrinum]|uniref:Uncharacterized protein n=1 Tax=Mycolicibacterium peregrinum TaxID=43304 RepID=A0A4Z0HQX0_MYCPR|nr:hypothetical protein [Mycolicibacterium peregrinum]TGB41449.1 hypothetical protein EJD98_16150 [Mycolicibacterium peregrinum]TGB41827.1 hypothetical protein EJD94_15680 [Mycolicibacterium peregrinum]
MFIRKDHCPHGHEIRSAADRSNQGFCRQCKRRDDRERRQAQRAVLDVVKTLEQSAGIQFQDRGVPGDPAEIVRQLIAAQADNNK